MSFPKVFIGIILFLICAFGIALLLKKNNHAQRVGSAAVLQEQVIEITLQDSVESPVEIVEEIKIETPKENIPQEIDEDDTQHVDRIQEFFNRKPPQLPIVQTITYKSKVPWLNRDAWIADYASHYKTSRHFIARSLNNSLEYEKQKISNGDKFNVFREDKDFQFYLLVNLKTCKMRFYYVDSTNGERVLLKTYPVGLGKSDETSESHYLTPVGKFIAGDKVAIYKPKTVGNYQNNQIEMTSVFGTRWIPFGYQLEDNTIVYEGLGIHGLPWISNEKGELVEDSSGLGKYQSDGCIRLAKNDIEELFAIIISKPTTIEIVNKEF